MRWSLLIPLFFSFACQSKPTAGPGPSVGGKVTRQAAPISQVPNMREMASPRKAQQLESRLINDLTVRKCLLEALAANPPAFDFTVAGHLSGSGKIEKPEIVGADKGLELCLYPALTALNVGQGPSGAFKVHVFRGSTPEQAPGTKKFE